MNIQIYIDIIIIEIVKIDGYMCNYFSNKEKY